jgi:hypothetical protein
LNLAAFTVRIDPILLWGVEVRRHACTLAPSGERFILQALFALALFAMIWTAAPALAKMSRDLADRDRSHSGGVRYARLLLEVCLGPTRIAAGWLQAGSPRNHDDRRGRARLFPRRTTSIGIRKLQEV